MGGRTFDQFISRQRAKAKDAHGTKEPSSAQQAGEQERLPARQPAVTKK